jgi:hypothetical protein
MHKVCAWRRIEARKKESLALSNESAGADPRLVAARLFPWSESRLAHGAVITTSTSAANASGFLQIPRRNTLELRRGHGAGVFRQPHQKPTD